MQVIDFVRRQIREGRSTKQISEALCDRCLGPSADSMGSDNMTVIIVLLPPLSRFPQPKVCNHVSQLSSVESSALKCFTFGFFHALANCFRTRSFRIFKTNPLFPCIALDCVLCPTLVMCISVQASSCCVERTMMHMQKEPHCRICRGIFWAWLCSRLCRRSAPLWRVLRLWRFWSEQTSIHIP